MTDATLPAAVPLRLPPRSAYAAPSSKSSKSTQRLKSSLTYCPIRPFGPLYVCMKDLTADIFHACQAVVPAMREAGAGRIVNIASLAGKEGTPNASAYSAAKAGVLSLTKSLGKELATSGILVNAVAPAAVRTGLLDQMSPAHVQIMIDKSPMQRLGEPGEVAEMVAWLCSASCTFNTGAIFDLSGGRAAY